MTGEYHKALACHVLCTICVLLWQSTGLPYGGVFHLHVLLRLLVFSVLRSARNGAVP
jgi:hypothetical protein